ncbi:MAG: phosphatase PAP2 family protein [Coleofasciculus sp. B1-GNL1-01]|uniref:phosphatase PAP2 family protein n=1 Tax=Coleofasciculus sp. B1-GNL1-01 TaxID=3068484 RepID=UPI0033031534
MTTIEWIQELLGQRLQPLVLAITNLGSEYAYIAFLTLYYWLIDPWTGRQLGLLLGISYGCNTILKELFDIPRPFELNPDIASADAIATSENASFPSGHVQGSATFWIYLSLHHNRLWLWVWSLILLPLIAISRLYLGVHFPIDVVAGLIVGILFAGIGTVWSIPVKPRFIVRVTVVILTFFIASLWEPLARSLGVITGFFLTQPQFIPPSTWKRRLLFGGIGLILVLTLFVGSRWVLGDWRNQGWVIYWRYSLLTLFATEVVPRLLHRQTW